MMVAPTQVERKSLPRITFAKVGVEREGGAADL